MDIKIEIAPEKVRLDAVGQNRFEISHDVLVGVSGDVEVRLCVPTGFQTDLGSVPRVFRPLLSVASAPVAFVVHDFLYSDLSEHSEQGDKMPPISRKQSDAVMLALMDHYRTPKWRWQRSLAYWGVRLGGWAAYRRRKSNADPS